METPPKKPSLTKEQYLRKVLKEMRKDPSDFNLPDLPDEAENWTSLAPVNPVPIICADIADEDQFEGGARQGKKKKKKKRRNQNNDDLDSLGSEEGL